MGIATLAHAELHCPDLEASREHFRDTIGMYETHVTDDAIYMRAFGDWQSYTLILRDADDWGGGHVAWMVEDEEDIDVYQDRIDSSGHDTELVEETEDPGQGRTLRFECPSYGTMELVHDIDRANDIVPDDERSRLKTRPSRKPEHGAGVRRIDHVNINVENVKEVSTYFEDVLDFKLREEAIHPEGHRAGAWMSVSPLVHEIAIVQPPPDANVINGLDHVAYYQDGGQGGELNRTADLLRERNIELVGGPAKHGISEANFMYYIEPSGNKVEVFAGGYLIFDPEWETVTWTPEDGSDSFVWWGGKAGEHARRQYDYIPTEESDWSVSGCEHLRNRE